MTLLAAFAATAAVLVAWPAPGWSLAVRLGGRTARGSRRRVLTAAGAAVGVSIAALPPAMLVLGLAVGTVGVLGWGQVQAAAARSARRSARSDTAEFIDVLAGYLRAGLLPAEALIAASDDHPGAARIGAAARRHGEVGEALRSTAREPGREALGDVAAAWQVAARSGAPLAALLERVAAGTRDTAEALSDIETAVAPARATGLLMGVLPMLGFSLGSGLGADPFGVITSNFLGAASVAAGVVLAAAGVVWIDRLATRAENGR